MSHHTLQCQVQSDGEACVAVLKVPEEKRGCLFLVVVVVVVAAPCACLFHFM